METATMTLEQMIAYAKRVAFKMSPNKDPEVESLANTAAWRAQQTFDPTRNVPLRSWIAICVRTDVWCYWRQLKRRKEEQREFKWWFAEVYTEDEIRVDDYYDPDWQLLVESHLLGYTLDVLARRRCVSIASIKQMIADAEQKLWAEVHS